MEEKCMKFSRIRKNLQTKGDCAYEENGTTQRPEWECKLEQVSMYTLGES